MKLILKLSFLLAMALAVSGLAQFYAYFNTGASTKDLITEAQQERLIHDPIYSWDIQGVREGVKLDEYTRQKIQDAYTAAWYILNKSNAEQKDLGTADKFSKRMVEKIIPSFDLLSNTKEERVDLEHHIKLHLFSYDRQVVSFTDQWVKVARKITNNTTQEKYLINDTLTFDVVMGLEDGYWKVFELVQLEEIENEPQSDDVMRYTKIEIPENLLGINYYPSEEPWLDFWPSYDPEVIEEDLQLVRELGFNHVRIFLPYAIFGKGTLNDEMVNHLDHFLEACLDQSITATITLFDFPESYHLAYYAATRKHFIHLLDTYKDHPAILIWDLKNEADLDFNNYGKEVVMDWLDLMIKTAKEQAPQINLTVGWSDVQYAALHADKLDVLSFHLYKDIDLERKNFHMHKARFNNKPLYVSEFGKTTYQATFLPFGSTKKEQAIYVNDAMDFMETEGIQHFAFWTLHDFDEAPKEVIGWKPWIRKAQANMGIVTTEGRLKPAFMNFEEGGAYTEQLFWHQKIKPFYPLFVIGLVIFLILATYLLKRFLANN